MFGWLKRIIPGTIGGGYRDLPLEQRLTIEAREELVAVQSSFPNTADYHGYLRAIAAAVKELQAPPSLPGRSSVVSEYILMPITSTYVLGVHALQEKCVSENNVHQPKIVIAGGELYRPNTFLENILARMDDYETLTNPDGSDRSLEDRKRFFDTWLDSCCGVAYRAGTTKFKLNLQCPELIGIDKGFNGSYLSVNYATFSGVELDSSSPNFVRDGWMTLLEGRTDVYDAYLAMLKSIIGGDVIPKFWLRQNSATDELRAVYVHVLDNDCDAYGSYDLYGGGRFLCRRNP